MPMILTPNGRRIRELRRNRERGSTQKELEHSTGISERALRRIENENRPTRIESLRRLAAALGVPLDDIVFAAGGQPRLASTTGEVVTDPSKERSDPEFIDIPRHDTALLKPMKTVQQLYEEVGHAQEIVPHLLAQADAERLALVEELLGILKTLMMHQWSVLGSPPPDAHDEAEFPDLSRQRRMAELMVLLKGNDIRVCAETHFKYYQPGETPWLPGEKWITQIHIAFAPPAEYGEENVSVPVDHGKDIRLPRGPILPPR